MPGITQFAGTRSLLLTRDETHETHGVTSLLRWQVASIRSNQMLDYEIKIEQFNYNII